MGISDACFEACERLDSYLSSPFYRQEFYDASIIARADALRAGLDALRLLLDVLPEASIAIEAAIAGNLQPLEAQVGGVDREWRRQEQQNLDFSPRELRRSAVAAVTVLRAIDQHLVPLLPELQPLLPDLKKDDPPPAT
jgi:hypothetical protein